MGIRRKAQEMKGERAALWEVFSLVTRAVLCLAALTALARWLVRLWVVTYQGIYAVLREIDEYFKAR